VESELIHSSLFTWTLESPLFVLVFWARQHWHRPKWLGRARPSKQISKNILKNLWFSRVFFNWILLNISLYFYIIKIQIQY
jgi:hypothetical protein